MQASWSTVLLAAALIACPANSDPSQGAITVRCLFHTIELLLPRDGTGLLGDGVYIGNNEMITSTFCRFPPSGRMTIPFPFESCGTKPKSDRTNVTFLNSIWKVSGATVEKYADFGCTYDSSFRIAIPHPEPAVIQNPLSDDGYRSRAVLCSTPFFCPRYVCPEEQSKSLYALYFDSDVMHLKLALDRRSKADQGNVAAIETLFITCGQSPSDSSLRYNSVTNGCQSRSATRRWDIDNTLQTYVDFNAHTDIVCMTISTPHSSHCPVFYIHGTLKRCNASKSEMCEDYSGAQCSGLAESHFVYGPVYVMSRAEGQSRIHLHRPETTSQNPPTTDDTFAGLDLDIEAELDAFGEFLDGRSVLQPKPGGEIEHAKIQPNDPKKQEQTKRVGDEQEDEFDMPPVATPISPKTQVVKSSMEISSTRRTTSRRPPFTPSFVPAKERSATPAQPSTTPPRKSVENIGERPSSENSSGNSERPVSPRRLELGLATEQAANNSVEKDTFNRPTRPALADVIPDDILQEAIFQDEGVAEQGLQEVEIRWATPAGDPPGEQNVRSPLTSTAYGVGKHLSLRQFNASEGSEVFIWSAVSSLGIFLLASIGLLIAWTGVRSRRRKSRSF